MPHEISGLPEELILRIFRSLEGLNDVYAVMLTCKKFHRISFEIGAKKISQLTLCSGGYFPALRPLNHFLLIASSRRLSEWAREEELRQAKLKVAMHGGVSKLAALALDVAPVSLDDIRSVWAWKKNILMPLIRRFDVGRGPSSRRSDEDRQTRSEDVELALSTWAVYGELFDHVLRLDWLDSTRKLDSVARFKFMIYCVPDMNSFEYMILDSPPWFKELNVGERFQQLSLHHAMDEGLNMACFADDIRQLTDIALSVPSAEKFLEPDTCDRDALFVQIVMNSGRRSLEVSRYADLAKSGTDYNAEYLVAWLQDTWASVQRLFESHKRDKAKLLIHTGDSWLDRNVASMLYDLRFTRWAALDYSLSKEKGQTEHEARQALLRGIASHN